MWPGRLRKCRCPLRQNENKQTRGDIWAEIKVITYPGANHPSGIISHLPSGSLAHLPMRQSLPSLKREVVLPFQYLEVWRLHFSCHIRAYHWCTRLRPFQLPGGMQMNTVQQVNRALKCKAQLLFIDPTPATHLNSSYLTWKLSKRLNAPLKQVILKQKFM